MPRVTFRGERVVGGCGRVLTALPTHGEASITSFKRDIVHYVTCTSTGVRQGDSSGREGDTAFLCVDIDDVIAPSAATSPAVASL